ncbi:MAG: alpha/beta hydrolase [Thermomicrobiales bacterium]
MTGQTLPQDSHHFSTRVGRCLLFVPSLTLGQQNQDWATMRTQSLTGESRVSSADGTPLWTVAESEVPLTVLLSNGGPGCPDYLAPLAGRDRRIVRWEQRGVGRSGGEPDGPFTIAQCLTDMEAGRRHYGCDRWVVAGHSWGADLSLMYALTRPERCVGILCVAGGRLNNDREWYAEYVRGVAEDREVPLQTDPPTNMSVNRQLSAEFKRYVQRPTLLREVADLQVPALFVYGTEDIQPSWAVAQVAALLPDAQLHLVPHADHYLYLTHPEAVRALADVFLTSRQRAM